MGQGTKLAEIRRRSPRFCFEATITLSIGEPPAISHGRALGLSASGIAAAFPGDLKMGDMVELEFVLPVTRIPLHVRAIVRNRIRDRYGLEFLPLSPAQRQVLEAAFSVLSPL